jgi:predicted negative regulator of RcsB-dependent stress response
MKVGPYELVRLRGSGAQAQVWEAEDRSGGRFALKVLFDAMHAPHPVLVERERWEREVTLSAALRHPCLPSLVDSGEDDAGLWLVSTLIRGEELETRYANSRPSDPFEFTAVLVCVCAALDALHHVPLSDAVGAVHRDIKPTNILMSGYGTEAFAWVVDLGTAKPLDGLATRPVGSYQYLSPEQIDGADPTPKVDVWATAAVAVWLLTGQSPVPVRPEETPTEYFSRRATRATESIAIDRNAVPPWGLALVPTLERALHPNPDERPGALELANDLASITWPDGAPYRIGPLLAGFGLHSVETAALELSAQTRDLTLATVEMPRAGLLELVSRLRPGRHDRALWRAIALLRSRADASSEAAEAAWKDAEAAGDPAALARAAHDIEEREGWEAAQSLWQKAEHEGSPAAGLRLARKALAEGKRDAGIRMLRRSNDRGHPAAAWELHQELVGSLDDQAEAQAALEAAVARGHPPALRSAGQSAYDDGHISEAERLWEAAADYGDEPAAVSLSRLHRRRGDHELAVKCLEDFTGVEAFLARGDALVAQGDDEEAARQFAQASELGSPRASGALGAIAWRRDDWPTAERHWRSAAEMGYREKLAGLGAALHVQGKRYEAELVYRSADDSVERTLLVAAVQLDRGDRAGACATLDENISRERTIPLSWSMKVAHEQIADLAPGHQVAALYSAELLRCAGPGDENEHPRGARCLEAYRHAAGLGSRLGREWAAQYEPDRDTKRRLVEDLIAEDTTGWPTYVHAVHLLEDGRVPDAVEFLRKGASLGCQPAMVHSSLRDAVDDAEEERLLRQADTAGSREGAMALGRWLQERAGARDPEVEAAYSRADLRGSAGGAVDLGLIRYALEGETDAVFKAYKRAERRGHAVGAFNLGVIYDNRRDLDRAAAQYRTAIDMGELDGYAALAELENTRGRTTRALQLAEEADERTPTWRTAMVLGDLRLKVEDKFGAIEAFQRADALGFARACIELADLWDDDSDINAALDRAEERISDDTSLLWEIYSPRQRAEFTARIRAIRRRRGRERPARARRRPTTQGPNVRVTWIGH